MSNAILSLGEMAALSLRLAPPDRAPSARNFVWYFATPYTSPDLRTRNLRADLATRATAQMLCGGLSVYSPITAHHPASLEMLAQDEPTHSEWMEICFAMLDRCDGLIVSTMDGYWGSKGVAMEIARWKRLRGNTKLMLFASPIREDESWVPQFSWQATKVEVL